MESLPDKLRVRQQPGSGGGEPTWGGGAGRGGEAAAAHLGQHAPCHRTGGDHIFQCSKLKLKFEETTSRRNFCHFGAIGKFQRSLQSKNTN